MSRTSPLRADMFDTGILGDGDGVHHGGSWVKQPVVT